VWVHQADPKPDKDPDMRPDKDHWRRQKNGTYDYCFHSDNPEAGTMGGPLRLLSLYSDPRTCF
jgi:hypothetical protein